jgi:RNA polymerase primary sigma factor
MGRPRETHRSGQDDNVLALYLKELNRIPLLSREEEGVLSRRAAAGDLEARHALIRANLRFVVNVAKRYQNQGLPLCDLISEGNIGLMNAISRYDPAKGYHFISYAVWWIRQAILKAIGEKSRLIRLPLNRANDLVRVEKVRTDILAEGCAGSGTALIARRLSLDPRVLDHLLRASREVASLDAPTVPGLDQSVLADFLPDRATPVPEALSLEGDLRERLNEVLLVLTRKEAEIIEHHFGLNGRRRMSLTELGAKYRLTKERVRQIEKRAIARLQSAEGNDTLRAYLGS